MKHKIIILFFIAAAVCVLASCGTARGQMALTDTTQIKQAIIALRQYDPYPHRSGVYQMSESDYQQEKADERSWGELANALELSLQFKTGYVLNAHQASMIKTAIDSKKEEDTYHASAAYKALKYKEEHPVYIRRDGTRVVPDSLADMTYGSGSGTPNYVEFRIGKKWINFYQTEPGIFKERK